MRKSNSTLWMMIFSSVFATPSFADEFYPLMRGARAQAMGNAFTAVADDEEAIFYNPAGLAGIKKFSLNLANANVEVSKDLTSNIAQYSSAFSTPTLSSVNTFMGKNIDARGQGSSSLVLPNFGIALLYDYQAKIQLQNQSYMQSLVGVQNTYGVQAAFGVPIFKLPKRKGEFRFGMAGKTLWRSGGYQEPTLTQLLTFDFKNIASQFTKSGVGYGLDSGAQFVYRIQKDLEFLSGLAMTDIGDTSFTNGPNPQKSNTTLGLATRYTRADMVATFAYDYSHLFDFMDWRLKTHLGLEVKFPLIRLYVGLSQLYPTYGAGLDIGLIRLMFVSYAAEQSVSWGVNPDRRFLGNVSIKLSL